MALELYPSVTTSLFFGCYGGHRGLHSFPTRRSSDLREAVGRRAVLHGMGCAACAAARLFLPASDARAQAAFEQAGTRSEEHTSELQSPDQLVCRLLLEKKKTVRKGGRHHCGSSHCAR